LKGREGPKRRGGTWSKKKFCKRKRNERSAQSLKVTESSGSRRNLYEMGERRQGPEIPLLALIKLGVLKSGNLQFFWRKNGETTPEKGAFDSRFRSKRKREDDLSTGWTRIGYPRRLEEGN